MSDKITITLSVDKNIEQVIKEVAKKYHHSKNGIINLILEKFVENGADLTMFNSQKNKGSLQGIFSSTEYKYTNDDDFINDIKKVFNTRDFE